MAINAERIARLPLAQKLLILGGIVLLIFVVYYLLVESKYREREQSLNTELTNLKSEIVKIRAIAAEKDKFERQNALLEKQLEELKAKLPSEAEMDKLLITITELGRDNGIAFNTFQPGKETSAQLYSRVPINMKFLGNFFHILRFFDTVAKLDRIVNMRSMSMKVGRSEMLEVTCTAETYKFKETPVKPQKAGGPK